VLNNSAMSIPPAIYSLMMFFTAALFGYLVNKRKVAKMA
jgi:BASS family bile acid:Na+ symporter